MFKLREIDVQIEDFMLYCETKGLSKKTMSSYEQTLKLFATFCEENFQLTDCKDVREIMIRQYIKYLQERGKYTTVSDEMTKTHNNPSARTDFGKKISNTTINNYLRNIKVFFNYLKSDRTVKINPLDKVKQIKNNRIPEQFIEDKDFERLLKCMNTSRFHTYRDKIIIMLISDTGMRIGECLLIKLEDLDLEKRCIFLPANNTKSKKDRYVFFSSFMQKELSRWIKYKDRYKESEYLFCTQRGNVVTIGTFESNFKVYAKAVGLSEAHPHQLRNNFSKRFLLNGGSIFTLSKLLGHSSVTVTEKAYLDVTKEDIRKDYQKFSPLANMRLNK